MAFVNEIIPESVKNTFSFPVQKSRSSGECRTLWKWTADHSRGIYLVNTSIHGGAYDGTPEAMGFALLVNGVPVIFTAALTKRYVEGQGNHLIWSVSRVAAPRNVLLTDSEVEGLISEALDVMGDLYSRANVGSVCVVFNSDVKR